jgi:hypothetical protein
MVTVGVVGTLDIVALDEDEDDDDGVGQRVDTAVVLLCSLSSPRFEVALEMTSSGDVAEALRDGEGDATGEYDTDGDNEPGEST